MNRTLALAILQNNDVFGSASAESLQALLARARMCSVARESLIFQQDPDGTSLWVVLSGKIRIEGVSERGQALVHRVLCPGDIFGEIALLDGGPRTAGAIASERSHLLWIDQRSLLEFLESNPRSAIALARLLARRIRATSYLLEDAIFLDARDRITRMLVELSRTVGKPLRGGVVVEVTHEELGRRTGLHRVSVTNKLKHLQAEGLVELDRGLILLRDVARLEALHGEPSR